MYNWRLLKGREQPVPGGAADLGRPGGGGGVQERLLGLQPRQVLLQE